MEHWYGLHETVPHSNLQQLGARRSHFGDKMIKSRAEACRQNLRQPGARLDMDISGISIIGRTTA